MKYISILVPLVCCALTVSSWTLKKKEAEPVKISLYYEHLCTFCNDFVEEQLKPAYEAVGNIMTIEMFAYGNTHEKPRTNGTGYTFKCQHGKTECLGNKELECGKKYIQDYDSYLQFAFCLDGSRRPDTDAEKCAENVNHDGGNIVTCGHSIEGEEILHNVGEKQKSLNPTLEYVPWILTNNVHNKRQEMRARNNLIGLVCDLYEGELPPACPALTETPKGSHV